MKWNELVDSKIYTDATVLAKDIAKWKVFNDTVVFTNGCFDILHQGHMDYLANAADLGGRLVIGVNTDASVQRLKGESRPIIDEYSRARKLASLVFVDAVICFDEPTPLELITTLNPDVLAKGGDYTIETIVGADYVLEQGGTVEVIPFLEGFSSSSIIDKIKKS